MNTPDRSRATGPALEKWYQFLRWLVPTVEKFPKVQKFTLGDRIQGGALDVLERLIEATYSRQATPLLAAANLGLEKLRFLFRLAAGGRHVNNGQRCNAPRRWPIFQLGAGGSLQ